MKGSEACEKSSLWVRHALRRLRTACATDPALLACSYTGTREGILRTIGTWQGFGIILRCCGGERMAVWWTFIPYIDWPEAVA